MSYARDIVIDNLFKYKNSPKFNHPESLFTIKDDKSIGATPALWKSIQNQNLSDYIGKNGLFTIVCTKATFENNFDREFYNNLYNLQPFIVSGGQGYYKTFTEQGFKTYPIINYDFDNIEAPHKRLAALTEQLHKLTRFKNLLALQKSLNKITIYNHKLFLHQVANEKNEEINKMPQLNTLQKFRKLL